MKNLKMNQEPLLPLNLSVTVLPLNQGPAASSQGPAASANSEDEKSEFCDEYSAQSQDSGRALLNPDLFFLTDDEHWTVTPETHKYAAAVGSFCVVAPETGEQQEKQFDHNAWCASDRQFQQHTSSTPKRS